MKERERRRRGEVRNILRKNNKVLFKKVKSIQRG